MPTFLISYPIKPMRFTKDRGTYKERIVLVLSRKVSEVLRIGDDITITIVRIGEFSVRIGIEAPKEIPITREQAIPHTDGDSGKDAP